METNKFWKIVKEDSVFKQKIFEIFRLECFLPSKKISHDFYSIHLQDWINVFAVTEDDQVILVRQHRLGRDIVTQELPAGIVDPGEDPEQAATRELLEETGYEVDNIILMDSILVNPAIQDNRCYFYLAQGCKKVGDVSLDHTEEVEYFLMDKSVFFEKHNSEWMDNSLSFMCVLLAKERLL